MMRANLNIDECLAGMANPDPAQFLTLEEADLVTYYRNCGQPVKQMINRFMLKCASDELENSESSVPGIFPGYIQRGDNK